MTEDMFLEQWMRYLLNQRTEYVCQDWRTCALINRVCRGKLYVDLFSISETIRGNKYLLTSEDSFSRYCRAYPIPNKEAHTVTKVLIDQHFNI